MNAFRRYSSLFNRGHRQALLAVVGAALELVGCTGQLTGDGPSAVEGVNGGTAAGGGGGGGPPIDQPPIVTPAGLVVGTTVIHRLSRTEYANTVKDLLGASLASLDTLPADIGGEGFSKTSVSQASASNTVQAYEAASTELVEAVFKDPKLKGRLVSCDLSTSPTCIRSTLETFLPKAWRRPAGAAAVAAHRRTSLQ
jgi:hypothetical protein